MTDVVDKKTRSRMMSGIQGKNTKPELLIRKALFSKGFRYKLHDKTLPGKPDLVFPKYNAVIFIHGCFWHMHLCHLFKWPSTRKQFWKDKIGGNAIRDKQHLDKLKAEGWRVLVIWECATKGKTRLSIDKVIDDAADWLMTGKRNKVIPGKKTK